MSDDFGFVGSHLETALHDLRDVLDRLVALADDLEPDGGSARDARTLRSHLDEPFLLVVVGEVKSGKSTFINTLLTRTVCEVGPTPLTDRIHVLRYGHPEATTTLEEFLVEHRLDLDLLRDLCVVDTPGTNSILRQHGEVTERFIPRADLVLFLTSIDRPYTASEDAFLAHISDHWRKHVVFVLTKVDGRAPEDIVEVRDYVRRSCLEHHGFEPHLLEVSSRTESEGGDGGFTAVRDFVRSTLSTGERARLKLLSPLRSSRAVLEALEKEVTQRGGVLDHDHQAVRQLDRQVEQAGRDLKERAHRFATELFTLFHECDQRARTFFDHHLRVSRIGLLRSSDRLRTKFESDVLGDLDAEFDRILGRAVDWVIREEIALYESVTAHMLETLGGREEREHLLPGSSTHFEYRREEILRSVQEGYEKEVVRMDIAGTSRRLLASAKRGVTQQVGLTVTAVGVGAGTLALASGVGLAVTGVAAALGLGAASAFILPAVRRRATRDFSHQMDHLVREVRGTYLRTLEEEVDGALERLKKGWEPFLRFYRGEIEGLREAKSSLEGLRIEAQRIEDRLTTDAPTVANPSSDRDS